MTTTVSQEEVEVTQADREAAAKAFQCKPLMNGNHDADYRVQAFARHRQQAERGEAWRPIETAPKDQLILVYTPDAKWRGGRGVSFGYAHSDYNGHKGVITLDGLAGPSGFRPTHWQPLPTPPEAGQ